MRSRPAIALLALWLAASSAAGSDELLGEWITPGYAARVRIHACKSAQDSTCGTITWLWEPVDRSGKPVRDASNGDATLRERPLEGLEILSGFRRAGAGRWSEGSIYNPEDGRRYSAHLRLRTAEVLEVEGCVLFICKQQIWRRSGAGLPTPEPAAKGTPP
ncbi:MAG: DUF2147 domain-containing protein [Burkholderiales bacterium]